MKKTWRTLSHSGVTKLFATEEECRAWAADEVLVTHDWVGIENWTPGGEDDVLNRGWACVDAIKPQEKRIKIEMLHTRDPDSECGIELWIDGVKIKDADIIEEGVDPGAGYVLAEWDEETLSTATRQDYTPAFRDAVVEARNDARSSEYITED